MIREPKIIVTGNIAVAKAYIGEAKSQMAILKRRLALGLKDEKRPVSLSPNVSVMCISDIRGDFIILAAGVTSGFGQEEIKKVLRKLCVCNCAFSTGVIVAITGTLDEANLYSVAVCNNEKYYALYENILASDFTIYVPGQKVIVIPYNENEYTCCTTRRGATGCEPRKSTVSFEDDAWRTTYRIIPWCGIGIPKWVEV